MAPQQPPNNLRIGIDIGGTFTDFVVLNPEVGDIQTFKILSTPNNPSEAVLTGLKKLGIGRSKDRSGVSPETKLSHPRMSIIHGSTVATNALLERKGARTALITTEGFKDILQIGRQNRPEIYSFDSEPTPPLVPADLRFEIEERLDKNGKVLTPINQSQVDDLIGKLSNISPQDPVKAVAVVFLFSFANPTHEEFVASKLHAAGFTVYASHEILPEYREYERTSTTVVNAYVSPILDRYLQVLEETLNAGSQTAAERKNHFEDPGLRSEIPKTSIQIMQSNGGCISVREARKSGVRCVLSGPAGGVIGSLYVGELIQSLDHASGHPKENSRIKLLTFDMGGTSTDVSLIDGQAKITSEAEVGGHPIRVPILDIHTIGAGGGSIAYKDPGGLLRVGPQSAGADPGPACYGRILKQSSDADNHRTISKSIPHELLPTVTDANLLLGRILPDYFLGGEMQIYPDLSKKAITRLGMLLDLDPYQTALGIIEIANAHMERALRVISVERGYDPRDFNLLSFGGAGGLHAADLARRLHIPCVLIPPYASTLSAFGMLSADVLKDYTQTIMLPGSTEPAKIIPLLNPMIERGVNEIQREGFKIADIHIEGYLDMRYKGQSYELTIPFHTHKKNSDDFRDCFHQEHFKTYGFQRPDAELEIVNLRVRAAGLVSRPEIRTRPVGEKDPSKARMKSTRIIFTSDEIDTPTYRGEVLEPGNVIPGPAVIVRSDTTILIGPQDSGWVDPFENLNIQVSCDQVKQPGLG